MEIHPQPTYRFSTGTVETPSPDARSYLPLIVLGAIALIAIIGLYFFRSDSKKKSAELEKLEMALREKNKSDEEGFNSISFFR